MSSSLSVPVSAKLRLCQPSAKTHDLAQRLEAQGASWITLHARTVSSKRRRQGLADLDVVKELKTHLTVPTISNGNVRVHADLQDNLQKTAADGLMVGETLLGNPWYVFVFRLQLRTKFNSCSTPSNVALSVSSRGMYPILWIYHWSTSNCARSIPGRLR